MASFLDTIKVKTAVDKRTQINLDCDHITTANFMQFNIAFSREIVPNQSVKIDMSTFARLQPLPVPTYGKARIQNRAFFVPFRTIFPSFNDFITDARHSFPDGTSSMIGEVPTISSKELTTLFSGVLGNRYGISSSTDASVDQYNSDYRVVIPNKNPDYYFIKLTKRGRHAMKILQSLGYQVPFYDDNTSTAEDLSFSALPLLAVAKVYADWYYPSMYASSVSFSRLDAFFNYDARSTLRLSYNDLDLIFSFLQNVNYDSDYFTSAWQHPVTPNTGTYSQVSMEDNTDYFTSTETHNNISTTQSTKGTPLIFNLTSTVVSGISQYALDALKSMTDYMKRHQLVGGRALDRYLARFGVKLSDEILKRSSYVGSFDSYIQFGDVMSQASTDDAVLGDYAGKGIGFANGSFTFQSDKEYGMLIIVSTIIPKVGYYQGIDRNVMHTTRLDFWTPEFDSLGVQGISRAELFVPEKGSVQTSLKPKTYYNKVFGFSPRYAEYKLAQDRLTGDFRYNSINQGMDSWHTMRNINPTSLDLVISEDFVSGSDAEQYSRIFHNQDDEYDKFIVIHNINVSSNTPFTSYWDTYEFESKGDDIATQANGVKMN